MPVPITEVGGPGDQYGVCLKECVAAGVDAEGVNPLPKTSGVYDELEVVFTHPSTESVVPLGDGGTLALARMLTDAAVVFWVMNGPYWP